MDEVIKIIAQKCKSLGMTGETGWKIKELHDFELSNRGDTVSIYMGRKNF